jgi:hypothetical protein
MTRRLPAAASATLAAIGLLLGACGADTSRDADGPPSTSPVDLESIPVGEPLEPGRYSVPFVTGETTRRAVVDLPSGYFGTGSGVISQGNHAVGKDRFGDAAFWGRVDQVRTDPCRGGDLVDAGSSVRDLARLLVAQEHRTTTRPTPVTLDGYHGLYLRSTAQRSFATCRGHVEQTYRARLDGTWTEWLTDDRAGAVDYTWILDLDGQRVVATIRTLGDLTPDHDELVAIIESVDFV